MVVAHTCPNLDLPRDRQRLHLHSKIKQYFARILWTAFFVCKAKLPVAVAAGHSGLLKGCLKRHTTRRIKKCYGSTVLLLLVPEWIKRMMTVPLKGLYIRASGGNTEGGQVVVAHTCPNLDLSLDPERLHLH